MTCQEAQELLENVWDLPDDDLQRHRLKKHIDECPSCAAEYAIWEESRRIMLALEQEQIDFGEDTVDFTGSHLEFRAETVNVSVMDRIYKEFQWHVEQSSRGSALGRWLRKRLMVWISAFLALFFCSFLYFAMMDNDKEKEPEAAPIGIIPTGVADSGTAADAISYKIPKTNSGIIDPLVAGIGPTHPQYWMILSGLGIGLALYFLTRLNRIRR